VVESERERDREEIWCRQRGGEKDTRSEGKRGQRERESERMGGRQRVRERERLIGEREEDIWREGEGEGG